MADVDVSTEVAAAPAPPTGGWDLFSDSSEGEGEGGEASGAADGEAAQQQVDAVAAAALVAQVLRACPRRVAEPCVTLPGHGPTGQVKLLLPASVLLVGAAAPELEALRERLAAAGAAVHVRQRGGDGGTDGNALIPVDCVVLLTVGFEGADDAERWRADGCLQWLLPGGTLLWRLLPLGGAAAQQGLVDELLPARLWLTAQPPQPIGASHQLICLRKVAVVANTTMSGDHVHYATKHSARERDLLEAMTVARSAAERHHGTLSEAGFKKASLSLRVQGLCVIRGLFDPAAVGEKAGGAVASAVAAKAADEGSFNVNTDKFTVRAPELGEGSVALQQHPLIVALLEAAALEPMPGTADGEDDGAPRLHRTALRRSTALLEAQSVGGVVALPGAERQAIHPDAEHLYEHTTLPPHYIVLFLPGCALCGSSGAADHDDSAIQSEDFALGQTAFFPGTHLQGKAGPLLANHEGSDSERERARGERLARPHCALGDAILFDARLLHFGLPNRSVDVARPLLYVNYHRPWFADFQPGAQIIVRHSPSIKS